MHDIVKEATRLSSEILLGIICHGIKLGLKTSLSADANRAMAFKETSTPHGVCAFPFMPEHPLGPR